MFINHVTTNPFFTPTQYGIDDASALLGTTSQWTGSETSDIPEMVNAFEAAIAGNADGIAVAIVDLEAFNDPIQEALDAGIPVVSYNADAPNARMAYVGQDLFGSGVAMGQRIVEIVGEGKVGLFIATPGQLNIQPRIDGAIQAIQDSGASIEFEQVETSAELPEELNRIEAWYLGNTDAAGMFAVDAGSTQGVGQVVQSHDARSNGLKGAGGYDLLPMTVQLVADKRARLHDRPAALPAGLPAGAVPLPLQVVGWGRLAASDEHGPRLPQRGHGGAVPQHLEPLRGRLG